MISRSLASVLSVAIWFPVTGFAGAVSFTPDLTEIVLGVDDPIVELDVTIASLDTLTQFDGFDLVMGSHDGLELVGFVPWSFDFCDFGPCSGYPFGLYPSDLIFGAFFAAGAVEPPFFIGTLSIDTSALGPGTYEILVDATFDQRSFVANGLPVEPLFGRGTIQIVPEPGALTFLSLAGLVILRRRNGVKPECEAPALSPSAHIPPCGPP